MSDKLACYAVHENLSRGRKYEIEPHPYRSAFERDRDRIIHCSAFRRLEGKTQVFTPGVDDYYRTRLTHSIEVSQIGRTIAKVLSLNENLTEAICLAHDLGHSPFGHAGEKVLDELMGDFGGFEHNRQSLRVVDFLEHPYPGFAGLNLMYETRLGLARHHTPYDKSQDKSFLELNCTLEGQVADIADRIAISSHDLEDAMRARLLVDEQLAAVKIFSESRDRIDADLIEDRLVRRTRTAKAILDTLVSDCVEASRASIEAANVKTADDVVEMSSNVIVLSPESESKLLELEEFLLANFYMHESVTAAIPQTRDWLGELFDNLCAEPQLMPGYFLKMAEKQGLERTVCDYIAGMTDRFCLRMLGKN